MNLQDLHRYREDIITIANQHFADNIRVFGSVARGEETENSDIDILVHFKKGASLLDEAALERKLTNLLKTKVHLISDRAVRKELEPFIMNEARPI